MQTDPNQTPADQLPPTQASPALNQNPDAPTPPPPQNPEDETNLTTSLPLKTIKKNLLRSPDIFVRDKKPVENPENPNPLAQPTIYYLDKTHPILDLLSFLSRELPSNSISEAPDVYPSGKLNIILENSDSSLKYTNETKNKNNHKRILSKTDSAVILIQIAEDLKSLSQEIIKFAQDKKATLTQNQQIYDPGKNSAFANFKSIFSDISDNISRSPQQEINNINKILTKDIKSLANHILNYLINFGELVIKEIKAKNQEEKPTPETTPTQEDLPTSTTALASGEETPDAGSEGGDDDPQAPDQPPQPTTQDQAQQDKELGLIDARYQNQVASLSNASLIFLFASLSTEKSQFDFFNSTNIDPEIRNELNRIGSSLVYDLILKYDGKDFNNPSTKLRIIQEASIKFQQDPRFRFYFQRVIDTHYLNLIKTDKKQEADEFSKKVASLTGENNQQFLARLEQFIVSPSTKEAQQANEQLEKVSWDTGAGTQTITLDNYHEQFSVILGSLLQETDPTKAQILANAIQDRIDFLISAHHGSFIEYLSIGKIEILIGQRIKLPDDPTQRDSTTKNIKKILAEYWKLRVAEHTKKLNSIKVGQELQTITEEQKTAFASQSDEKFANYLDSFHPPEMRQMSARNGGKNGGGIGASFVAATNLSQEEIVALDENVKNEYHALDVSLSIREYLARTIVDEARKRGYDDLVDQYVVPGGTIDANANISDIQQDFYRNETYGRQTRHALTGQTPYSPQNYGTNTPFGGYSAPSVDGSTQRNSQNLDAALKVAGAIASKYNPLLGKAVTWLSKKENRMIAGGLGATGIGILISSLNTVGGWVGAIGGAAGGAAIGATIGSFFGPAGTIIGGIAGGTLGAVGGAAAGKHFIGGQLSFGGGASSGGGAASAGGLGVSPQALGIGQGAGALTPGAIESSALGATTLAKTAGSMLASTFGPTAVQAIALTTGATALGTLFITSAINPVFQVDFGDSSASFSLGKQGESDYARVKKKADVDGCNSLKCDNPGSMVRVTYTIQVEPKDNFTLTITNLEDIISLAFNSKTIANPPKPTEDDIERRLKTLQKIREGAVTGYDDFFDEEGNIIPIQPGQILQWQYVEEFPNINNAYKDFSMRNVVKVEFDYTGTNARGDSMAGKDVIMTGENICFGECPDGLGCWPVSGNASQMPFGSYSHSNMSRVGATGIADAIDISGNLGDNVYSPFDGELCRFENDASKGYGHAVVLEANPNNGIPKKTNEVSKKFMFAHLNNAVDIESVDGINYDQTRNCITVERGVIIGIRGSSGNSTGPHLHFEISVDDGWYSSRGGESELLSIMPDGLTTADVGAKVWSCYDNKQQN